MPDKSCLTCAYRNLDPQKCQLIGYDYAANPHTSCPYHSIYLTTCGRCGRIIIPPDIYHTLSDDNTWRTLCKQCNSLSGLCPSCSSANYCDFENNPSPLPKAVEKRFQQGNQIMITTVKNEARVKETCAKNCKCFSEEFGCLRENGTCGNYTGAF